MTNASGAIYRLNIGVDAVFESGNSALRVWDRSPDTMLPIASHVGTTVAGPYDYDGNAQGSTAYNTFLASQDFEYFRTGGVPINNTGAPSSTVLQGVRAYDPGIGIWTTPDAYAGDISDPQSQMHYMWNRNNPVEYSDPSGYCPVCVLALPEAAVGSLTVIGWGAAAVGLTSVAAGVIQNRDQIQSGINHAASAVSHAASEAWKSVSNRLPRYGPPNTTVTRGDGKQRRTYGASGGAEKDIDYGHDHGVGDPHAHDWRPGPDGQPQRGPGRPLSPSEEQESVKPQ